MSNFIYNITELFNSAVLVSLAMTPVIMAILVLRKLIKGKVKTRYTYIMWSWVMAGVLFASVSLAGGFNIAGGVTSYIDNVQENRSQIAAGNVATGVADTGSLADSKVQTEGNQHPVQNHVINENTLQNAERISVREGLESFTDNYGHYLAFIWIGVGIALIIRMMISFIKLRASLRFACKLPEEENVYESVGIKSSFVLGIVKPKIYVPEGVGKAELDMILRHEKAHIEAKDNITIVLAYIILAVFWFNPVFWLLSRQRNTRNPTMAI